MILIDSNALIVLLLGLMNPEIINHHKRTSPYDKEDFYNLLIAIKSLDRLVVLPNIWTEVDNVLNDFRGNLKYIYISKIITLIKVVLEKYLPSNLAIDNPAFYDLGITDALVLHHAKNCEFLITSDSVLSDYAVANGIKVYDMIKIKNERLK